MYIKTIQVLKAIKIRIYPSSEQVLYLNSLLGSSRFVYNQCLAFKIKSYNENKKTASFKETGIFLTSMKETYTWLRDNHSKVLQQSLVNLESAYKNFFKNGNGFPTFKKKSGKQSCRFPSDAIGKIEGNRITIVRQLTDIHFKCSRSDEKYLNKHQKDLRSATLSKTLDGKFYLSILVDREITKVLPKTEKIVGVDLGIKDFIVTSDGGKIANPKLKRMNEKKLATLHKRLSRKTKGGKNREKSRVKLAKFYDKLNNKKEYFIHQTVNQLLDENQVIAMENLNVSGMMKNHKLARSIQEVSFGRFKDVLKYKASWLGRDIIEVDRFFPSSKLCSECGEKNKSLTLSTRTWTCSCGSKHDRDINAAKNIQKEGLRILEIRPKVNNNIGLSSPEFTPLEISSVEQSKPSKEKSVVASGRRIGKNNVNS